MKKIKLIISILISVLFINNNIFSQEKKDSIIIEKETKAYQITFISPLGTSGTSSYKYSNDISFNVLGGYNGGVKYFELGGLVNINKGDVFGGQIAGITNVNFGKTQAIQFAGVYNQVSGDMEGLQVSGFMNLNMKNTTGLSIGGFTNIARDSVTGWLISGFANVVGESTAGAQFAGFGNFSEGDVSGVQLASFINVAKNVKGVQLAFLNIADSVDGVPVGFISIVKNGYHKFEVSSNESFYGNLTAKTGVKHFYNIFTAGIRPVGDNYFWSVGYGIGSELKLSKKLNVNIDVTGSHVNENNWTTALNVLGSFKLILSYKITNGFEFFAGSSYNVFVTDLDEGINISEDFIPWHFYNETYDGVNVKMYLGFNAGLRF